MKPRFFSSPPEWRRWLAAHHQNKEELWVGFHKKSSGSHLVVIGAKRPETPRKRLAALIGDSGDARTMAPLTRKSVG